MVFRSKRRMPPLPPVERRIRLGIERAQVALDGWKKKRQRVIRRRVKSGETLERIAVDYDLTRERIRQIYLGQRTSSRQSGRR